jgi:hypothetical protein
MVSLSFVLSMSILVATSAGDLSGNELPACGKE